MNDEIKEILENVKKCCDITKEQSFTVYQRQDILKLLDCITNLQKDLEKANDISAKDRQFYKSRMNEYVELKKENEKLDIEKNDYKSRVEKAVEYIEKHSNSFSVLDTISNSDLLNILQNGSDEK